jgi:hypothetical protein
MYDARLGLFSYKNRQNKEIGEAANLKVGCTAYAKYQVESHQAA